MEYYWQLETYDGEKIDIPPTGVDVVKRRWDKGETIHTSKSGSVAASSIKSFRPTSKPYGQPLLEAAAQAFKEPIFFETETGFGYTEEVIEGRWVKKDVTQRDYAKNYSQSAYHKLHDEGNMVTVAFMLPIHDISLERVQMCTGEEERELDRKRLTY